MRRLRKSNSSGMTFKEILDKADVRGVVGLCRERYPLMTRLRIAIQIVF